ncbi:transmembrane protein 87A-like [Cynara cardunculus var. scolymus]|uniref:transmembrane protein 87A-like n=1 Tax=Cynara cardunculus var. scolymus TaxID=59895 RepID=UPI000D62B2A1|nr:transmembrane protein 87A-like [Cynara cardunculus var. scolymus]
MDSSTVAIFLLLVVRVLCIEASVHEYAGDKFTRKGNAFVLHGGSEGIYYSRPNLHQSSATANGDAYIRIERIIFRRPQVVSNFSTGLIYAVLFDVDDRETIGGSAYGGQRAICCTADLAKLGACKEGEVIHRQSLKNPGWPEVFGVSFDVNEETSTMQPRSIEITRTGMYNLYFMHCEPRLNDMIIEGKTVWKNPTGYLPGRMAPLSKFYGFMSFAFLILGSFWFSQYARFWKEVLQLQNCITLVITLGMFEMALWYFDYAEFNKIGIRPTGITVWAVTFGTVKRTVSRMIILTVSMGYGVVRPTLGGLTSKVIMLGATFFTASEVLELAEHAGAISDLSGKAMLFLSLPVAILDAFFLLWIFTSLSSTLNKLQAKRMMAKLDIYRKFTNALAVAVIVSVGWICYELYFKATDIYNEQWQNAWIIPAFWQVLSFSLLCVICALWAPSQNSMRYAYSDDGSEEFEDGDISMLMKLSPLPTKDVGSPTEVRSSGSEDGTLGGDLEEDKTE